MLFRSCSGGEPFADVPFDKKPDGELSLCLGEFFGFVGGMGKDNRKVVQI